MTQPGFYALLIEATERGILKWELAAAGHLIQAETGSTTFRFDLVNGTFAVLRPVPQQIPTTWDKQYNVHEPKIFTSTTFGPGGTIAHLLHAVKTQIGYPDEAQIEMDAARDVRGAHGMQGTATPQGPHASGIA